MRRSERRHRKKRAAARDLKTARSVFGVDTCKCRVCGKNHREDPMTPWPAHKTLDWLRNDQDDRRLETYAFYFMFPTPRRELLLQQRTRELQQEDLMESLEQGIDQ